MKIRIATQKDLDTLYSFFNEIIDIRETLIVFRPGIVLGLSGKSVLIENDKLIERNVELA